MSVCFEPRVSQASGDQHRGGLVIQRYLQVLLKRKRLFISTFVFALGIIAVWTFTRPRIYRATATVLVDQKAPQVLGKQVNEVVDLSMGAYRPREEYMETQRRVISSKTLALKVAERMDLVDDHAFWLPESAQEGFEQPILQDAASRLTKLVSAKPVRDSYILEISVEHVDPNTAMRLANMVAKLYMDHNIEYKASSTASAVQWLSAQLDDLKQQLEKAELNLYEFKKKHNIISLSLEERQNVLTRQIEKLTDALTDIRMRRMALRAERKQLLRMKREHGNDPLRLSARRITGNLLVRRLKESLAKEQRDYLALKKKYLGQHPQVMEQKAKVDATRRDLEREINGVLASVKSTHQEILDNESQLTAALQQAKEEALELNKRDVTYRRLKRSQENTAKLHGLVLTRMKESDLSGQLRVNNIRPLDSAAKPTVPIRPRVKVNLMWGTMLSLLLGLGLAFLANALDNSIKSQDDVELVRGLVFMGLMPRIPDSSSSNRGHGPGPRPGRDLIVHHTPMSRVAEACRSIRTNILFASTDRSMKTMLVTSPRPREGKTTTAVSIAITMAQAGSRVLLVDTDMRRPRLHKVFGVLGGDGLTSVLLGGADIDQVIKGTDVPNLYVLPCGPIPPNPAEICHSSQFAELLDQLAEHYDRVLLDSPPAMVVTDAVVLSTLVEGNLVVARTNQTSRTSLRETVRQLRDVNGRLLGCVLNDVDLEHTGHSQYSRRRYGYSFKTDRYGYGTYREQEEEASS